jgi:hypothetical protein
MKRKIAGTIADPTLPKTPITIGDTTYNLCFDLGALAEAELAINTELVLAGRPERVNLLNALPIQNLINTRLCFAAAIRTFHPEISFERALAMLNLGNVYDVRELVSEAWRAVQPAKQAADPQQPGE